MKAQENWIVFNEKDWTQNGRFEIRLFGTVKWLVSDYGQVKREYYDLNGQYVKTVEVHQHWKGRTKKYLAIPTGEYVHRLVAQHFIPNLANHRLVLFVDGDLTNTHFYNLQWSDGKGLRTGIKLGPRKRNTYSII